MSTRSIVFLICLGISACASYSPEARRQHADRLAMAQHWQRLLIPTQAFDLAAYVPAQPPPNQILTIYIEGDGLAWLNRHLPSSDPTPKNPLGLQLALRHPAGNSVYLARPCQHVTNTQSRNCARKYWTSHRFAPEVIAATNEAVTLLKARLQARALVLVGYSGGGAVAALVAARRDDVMHLITVAGNLDHPAWTRQRGISALGASLNPADAWRSLVGIPQTHFIGINDKVIDPAITHAYQQRFPADKKPEIRVIEGFDHHCCWVRDWGQLFPALRQPEPPDNKTDGQ